MENDRSYFMRRAAQERSAATQAADDRARAVHRALAEHYRELAQGADTAAVETDLRVGAARY